MLVLVLSSLIMHIQTDNRILSSTLYPETVAEHLAQRSNYK